MKHLKGRTTLSANYRRRFQIRVCRFSSDAIVEILIKIMKLIIFFQLKLLG
jgi:hypothetical protein